MHTKMIWTSLCKAAASLGYDIIILTHMIGSHQVVTEVLDTREDSSKYLWYLDTN
jgi:hypothetical protein